MVSSIDGNRKRGWKCLRYLLALLLVFSWVGCAALSPDAVSPVQHLVVLHTNDTHGHPVRFFYYPAPGVGGLPARATLVRQIRSENENVLVLDAGDLNTGRPESSFFKAEPDILGYNYVGYDAMAVGNHEFDNPIGVLRRQMETAEFPFLSANVKDRDGQTITKPFIIRQYKGFKVAVFGLTTKETEIVGSREGIKGLVFEDEVQTAKVLVPELRKKADVVIALVHMGLYSSEQKGSKRLAALVDGIDLIVDGHTHTRLESPVMVRHAETGRPTPIVQAWMWGLVMGRVDLRIRAGKVEGLEFKNIPINLKRVEKTSDGKKIFHPVGEVIEEDQTLVKMLQPFVERVDSILSEVIGHAEGHFFQKDVRKRETAIGDLVADSMKWYTRAQGVDFAIQNGGGIRADLPSGEITKKRIYEVLPFDNSVVILTLNGSDLIALFQYLATVSAGNGAFPQVSEGVGFTIDPVSKQCRDIRIRGKSIDPAGTYRVATNSYLAGGGDGYKAFLKAASVYDTSKFQRDVLIAYIKSLGGRIRPVQKNRFRVSRGPAVLRYGIAAASKQWLPHPGMTKEVEAGRLRQGCCAQGIRVRSRE